MAGSFGFGDLLLQQGAQLSVDLHGWHDFADVLAPLMGSRFVQSNEQRAVCGEAFARFRGVVFQMIDFLVHHQFIHF